MSIKSKSRNAVKAVLDALFERAANRLLGRHANRIYFQIVKGIGIENSLESVMREAAALNSGTEYISEEALETQNDEVKALFEAQKNRTFLKIVDAIKAGKSKKDLKDILKDTEAKVDMIVSEETNKAKNLGLIDSIDQVAASQGIKDPTLIWIGKIDGKLCPYCIKMYHCKSNIRIPRAWKRSQLVGSYFNRKTWDGSTVHYNAHPACRHSPTIIMPSFGLDASGSIQYMGLGYDEYEEQKKRGDT